MSSVKRIWPFVIPGVLLVGAGLVWMLQGLNVLGGSVMSGSSFWATIGPMVAFVGLVLIAIGVWNAVRRNREKREHHDE